MLFSWKSEQTLCYFWSELFLLFVIFLVQNVVLLFVLLLMHNVVLRFVLLMVQTCVLLLVLFKTTALACRPSARTLVCHWKWSKPCATSGAKFCDPFCDTSGAKSVILSVLLLVPNVVLLCVLLLVQNVVLLFVILVQNLEHSQSDLGQKTFELRQFLCLVFYLGRPWLC